MSDKFLEEPSEKPCDMGTSIAIGGIETMARERRYSYITPSDYSSFQPSDRDRGSPGATRHDSFLLSPTAKKWLRNYWQPYRGFTSDGTVHPVWQTNPTATGPTEQMVLAAQKLLLVSTAVERERFRYLVTAREWRAWSDPDVSGPGSRL